MRRLLTLVFFSVQILGCTTPPASAPLSPNTIEWEISKHSETFSRCFNLTTDSEGHLKNADLLARFAVNESGKVTLVEIRSSTFHSEAAETCLIQELRALRFPSPSNGKSARAEYHFRFRGN